MHVLRAEKGYIIVGQDTDGTVTQTMRASSWAVGKTKPDFVGKRSLQRPDMLKLRPQATGRTADRDPKVGSRRGRADRSGAGRRHSEDDDRPCDLLLLEPELGRSIALAVVAGGHALKGQSIYVPMAERTHQAIVSGMVFVDPEGKRLKA